jgi:hypothetical protein
MSNENPKATEYCKTLDDLYGIIQSLTPTSPPSSFSAFAQFFAPDCTVYFKSMNMHRMPGISRAEAIDDIREVVSKLQIRSREVLHFAVSSSSDGRDTVFCETRQRIDVLGETIEPFFETHVVEFGEGGLITGFRNYCCWSPVVDIVQRKTGLGPYAVGEKREEFERYVREVAVGKMERRRERERERKGNVENGAGGGGNGDASCCT